MRGPCAKLGRTLDQHCNKESCKLYWTKKGTTPTELKGFAEATFVLRARQKAGYSPADVKYPYWAERAHIVGNSVFTQIENEFDEDDESGSNKTDFSIKGEGDSGAFALIHRELAASGKRLKEDSAE